MQANLVSITGVLSCANKYYVPFFQRRYVWKDSNREKFLDSMEEISENDDDHFFGSIILKRENQRYKIVDGQQRLTTFAIFCKVHSLRTGRNNFIDTLFRYLGTPEFNIRLSYSDQLSFDALMNLETLKDINGDNEIVNAYKFFQDKIKPEKIDFQKIFERMMFVKIELNQNEDEQLIFNTINALGVKLTTGELVKNFLFNEETIDNYERY